MNLRGGVMKTTKVMLPVLITFVLLIGTSGICGSSSADDQAHELTVKALHCVRVGDYDGAINYYRAALKFRPDDEGIQICIGKILYLKDKQKGIKPNPKVEFLLDSLQAGEGNWEASIGYLKGALAVEKDKQKSQTIRDALCELEGIYAQVRYEELYEEAKALQDGELAKLLAGEPRDEVTPLLRNGFKSLEQGDYENAIQNFRNALNLSPEDPRLRDILNYTEGLLFAQQESQRRWAEDLKDKLSRLGKEAMNRWTEARSALERAQKALKLSEEAKDAEAVSISQRAIHIAKETLAKAQALIIRLETRFKAVEKNQSLGSKGRLGIAGVVRGRVYRNTEKGWVSLDPNTPFSPGEELRTGSDGFAELILTDGSTIQIGPDSTMKLIKITRGQSFYEMLKGHVHAEMSCLKATQKPCREVQIGPGVAVAVRGTEFDIDAPLNGPVTVTVVEGLLEITDKGKGMETRVQAGDNVVITARGEIREPTRTDIRSMKRWWED
jgi:ferric-dicitrate binding protein FerR (iron transport regulator)